MKARCVPELGASPKDFRGLGDPEGLRKTNARKHANLLAKPGLGCYTRAIPLFPNSPAMFIPESPKPIKNAAPVARIPGLTPEQLDALKAHWIISIQEFLALADLPSARPGLTKLLGVDDAGLETLISAARKQLAPSREGDEEDQALDALEYAAGALEPPPAMREEVQYETIPHETPFPPALSYSDELPPIRNQGSRGTCVAHAAAAVREFLEIQRLKHTEGFHPRQVNFSEQFIYWWCKEQDGMPLVSGTYPALGMQCLAEAGVSREKTWPYNPNPKRGNESQGPPPEKALQEAQRYRIRRVIHLRPDDIDSMKAALLQGKSVMITIPMFESWFHNRATRKFGKINLPLPEDKSVGAHALALVGFVDDADAPGGGYFILRNAWKPWALSNPLGKGLGTIPYAFLQEHNLLADSGELLTTADVYIRDNENDEGEAPSRGMTFDSPDIWVRRNRDDGEEHQQSAPDGQNWLYVRAWNLGPEIATQVRAQVFVAPASPSIWPDMWQPLGEISLPNIPANESASSALAWRPQSGGDVRFLVRLHAAEDPAQHDWAVQYDNNIAQKNMVQRAMKPGEEITLAFPIYGLPEELTLRHIRVDRKGFREGRIGLSIEAGQSYRDAPEEAEDRLLQTLAGQATERRLAVLTIRLHEDAGPNAGGRIVISQKYGKALVGRMLVEIVVASA